MLNDRFSIRRSAATAAVAMAACLAVQVGVQGPAAQAAALPACGAVTLPGSAWLNGRGVDVHYNTHVNGSTKSCGTESYANPSVQYGNAWQCVELAARLYYVRGWGGVWTGGNGGAKYIPEGSPSLLFFANGSGYTPVPGDLVVENGGTYGHVAVVDRVSSSAIETVEQNVAVAARHTYPFAAGVATGGYYSQGVRGFMHSPLNGGTNSTSSVSAVSTSGLPTTPVIGSVKKGSRKVTIKWGAPVTAVNLVQVWVRTYNSARQLDSGRIITVKSSARKKTVTGLTGMTRYRFNVRAGNSVGTGNWSNGRNARPLR